MLVVVGNEKSYEDFVGRVVILTRRRAIGGAS